MKLLFQFFVCAFAFAWFQASIQHNNAEAAAPDESHKLAASHPNCAAKWTPLDKINIEYGGEYAEARLRPLLTLRERCQAVRYTLTATGQVGDSKYPLCHGTRDLLCTGSNGM